MEELDIRWLTPEEYENIAAIMGAHGMPMPDPDYCKIAGAFEGDTLVGFMCLQYVAHAEPTHITEKYRSTGLWRKLADFVDSFTGDAALYVCAPDERVAHMCTEYGFIRIGDLYERK